MRGFCIRKLSLTTIIFFLILSLFLGSCSYSGNSTIEQESQYISYREKNFTPLELSKLESSEIIASLICENDFVAISKIYQNSTTENLQNPVAPKYLMTSMGDNGEIDFTKNLNEDFTESESPVAATSGRDSTILVLTSSFDMLSACNFNLYTYDISGTLKGTPLKIDVGVSDFAVGSMLADVSGNLYISVIAQDGSFQIICFDEKGNKLGTVDDENVTETISSIDGAVYTIAFPTNKEKNEIIVSLVSPQERMLKEKQAISLNIDIGNLFTYDDTLYISNSVGLYSLTLKDKTVREVLLWKSGNINYSSLTNSSFLAFSNKKFVCIEKNDFVNETSWRLNIIEGSSEEIKNNKNKIIVAGINIDKNSVILQSINEFNKSSSSSVAEVKNYKTIQELNADMLTDQTPDVLVGTEELSLQKFRSAGFLKDLGPIISADSTYKGVDYVGNLLTLSNSDEKVFLIPTHLRIEGLLGAKSILKDINKWSVKEFDEVALSLPKGTKMIGGVAQLDLLQSALLASIRNYIDETNTCNFIDGNFYQLLEWAKNNGEVTSKIENIPDAVELIKNKQSALYNAKIFSVGTYHSIESFFGESTKIVGYPEQGTAGANATCWLNLGVVANTKSEVDAWNYIKILLSEPLQESISNYYGIPINLKVLEKQINLAIQKPKDESNQINDYPPLSDETAKSFSDMVYGTEKISFLDDAIWNIIAEEVQPYFEGQKSKEQAVEIIQNRVQTYLNETNIKAGE